MASAVLYIGWGCRVRSVEACEKEAGEKSEGQDAFEREVLIGGNAKISLFE